MAQSPNPVAKNELLDAADRAIQRVLETEDVVNADVEGLSEDQLGQALDPDQPFEQEENRDSRE